MRNRSEKQQQSVRSADSGLLYILLMIWKTIHITHSVWLPPTEASSMPSKPLSTWLKVPFSESFEAADRDTKNTHVDHSMKTPTTTIPQAKWRLVSYQKRRIYRSRRPSMRNDELDDEEWPDCHAEYVTSHKPCHDHTYTFPRGMVKAWRSWNSKDYVYYHGERVEDNSRRRCFKRCRRANIKKQQAILFKRGPEAVSVWDS